MADAATIENLNDAFGRPGAARFEMRFGGPVALLQHRGAAAVVALQGAQVLSYVPAGGEEVLWLSPVAQLSTAKAVRGGIPVCWPWFGPHPDGASKPAHGFVRAAPWQVIETATDDLATRITLRFDAATIDPALWPHQAIATLTAELASSLKITLETVNEGANDISLSQALHSYFAVGDVSRVVISGLNQRRYIDQLDRSAAPVQSGEILIAAEVDRIYQDTADDVIIADASSARAIKVAKSGSASTVVWNPWLEKGERLGDLGAGGHSRFVCIETANAGSDIQILRPGARHSLVQEISPVPLLK